MWWARDILQKRFIIISSSKYFSDIFRVDIRMMWRKLYLAKPGLGEMAKCHPKSCPEKGSIKVGIIKMSTIKCST